MNFFTPAEVAKNYCAAGKAKAERNGAQLFLLAILAGFLIAGGAVVSNTAAHALDNVGMVRMVSGLLFAFGLPMVILSGAELFTGNCLICIPVLTRETTALKMARNLVIVYLGNFVGALLTAWACVYTGQFNYSSNGLAAYTIKIATAKCSLDFGKALVMGILCNLLVCLGVICALAAKDVTGKILGAFLPVAFFVIGGFEHSIANMYYVPAGLLAQNLPQYAEAAAAAGVDTAALTWGNFLVGNLLPVTIGNIIGGVALGALGWFCFLRTPAKKAAKKSK